MKLVIGIDEVGRGPLAGPVSIGIVVMPERHDISRYFDGLRDSKQMTEKAREKAYAEAELLRANGTISFGVFSTTAAHVDEWGIEAALSVAIAKGLSKLAPSSADVSVLLDGRLKAPKEYAQRTIIGGDGSVPVISLASVVAKVSRDRYMSGIVDAQFPEYGFGKHKGYGTEAHIRAIRVHGPCPEHRKSFLGNVLPATTGAGRMSA